MNRLIAVITVSLLSATASGSADAGSAAFRDHARVVDVDPIVRWREVPVKHRVCKRRGDHGHKDRYRRDDYLLPTGADADHYASDRYLSHRRHNGRHCRMVTEYRRERHVDGYRVTYRYHGHIFTTRTEKHPGRRIPVKLKIRPML